MILPHHKPEWRGLANEDAVLNSLRGLNIPPGQYTFPHPASPQDWKSDFFQAKMKAGPTGTLTVAHGMPNMFVNMLCTVLFFMVANFAIAYMASLAAIPRGADFMTVFRFVGTAGIITYGTANILNGIWFNRKMVADIADGIVYGLITGLIFALMWLGAAA